MMNAAYVYLQLYKLFDSSTPVAVDCGELCGKACCRGDDSGMLLFPGEEDVYGLLKPNWIRIEKTDFKYEYNGKEYSVPLAMCDGVCDRYQRPLACRIFPLTPYLGSDGKIKVLIDPRAKGICPMAKAFYIDDFDERFLSNVEKAFILLAKNKRVKAFLKEYSSYIDEFKRFYE